MDLREQFISKFAQTAEGAGLRKTEAACAFFMVAGFIADTQIVDRDATRKNAEKLDERIWETFSRTSQEPVNLT